MQNFKDATLRDSKFLIDLIDAIKPSSVDYDLVTMGTTGKHIPEIPHTEIKFYR